MSLTKDKGESNSKIYIKDITNFKELETFFDGRAEKHGNKYFHYTTMDTLNRILSNGEIWVSQTKSFNDKKELNKELHNFAFCLSTGDNENLSLWYLYSGVDGKGCRIRFTKKQLELLYKSSKFFLCENNVPNNEYELIEGENLTIYLKDVLYYREKEKVVDLKYNNSVNHQFPLNDFKEFKKANSAILKDIVWYYEKETRIEFVVNNKISLDERKNYIIKIKPQENFIEKLTFQFAPEINEENLELYLNQYDKIKKHFFKNPKFKLSENAGCISMKLCDKCEYRCIKTCDECKKEKDAEPKDGAKH